MMKSHITSRWGRLIAVATPAVLLGVGPAQAQGEPPGSSAVDQYVQTVPSTPSVDQYVEAVPTGTGSSAPGVTAEAPSARGGGAQTTSRALKRIARSSNYGAPAPGRMRAGNAAGRMPDPPATTSVSASLRSTLGALGTASDARLLALLAVVLVTTIVAIGLATRRGSI